MLKNVMTIIFDYLLHNSLSNKVIQIKGSFYNVILRQPFFPLNIGNYFNSQSFHSSEYHL